MGWYVYIVKCRDNSLYTGITKDIKRRVQEHNFDNKLGARSLRSKRPVTLVYYETFEGQSEAAKREQVIKKWTRKYKLRLVKKFISEN